MTLGSRFDPGGLFRCCIQTIVEDNAPETIGRKMRCKWCDAPMIVVDPYGYPEWAWDREGDISLKTLRESIRRAPGGTEETERTEKRHG